MLPCSLKYSLDTNYEKKFPVTQNIYRHSYLLRDLSCITDFNPRLIMRSMDRTLSLHTTNRNLDPPFQKLAALHPIISQNVDSSKEKIAFGRWALPRLKKQIKSNNIFMVMQALNSINDLVHCPERAFQAISIGMIDRLKDMMLHERDFVREKICMIFSTLAKLDAGKRAVIRRYEILKNLGLLLEDPENQVRLRAQGVLELLCLSPLAAEALNQADFLVLLLRLIGGTPCSDQEDIIILNLEILKKLLDRDHKEVALKHNAMDIMVEKINHENLKIKCKAIECLAILCQTAVGREEAAAKNIGLLLCKTLFSSSMEVRIKVAGALAFATIQSDTRKGLCKKCTIEALMEIAENFHNSEGQMMASKVLMNLCEHAEGKKLMGNLKKRVKKILALNEDVARHKKLLLDALKKKV